jgi:ammonium transporter Rh
MIGTLFLWMFWPSFNGALAPKLLGSQHRVIINTVFALSASCLTSFALSIGLRGKFCMEDIQNATLAGGVAVGSSSDLVIGPGGALIIGVISGAMSTVG